MMARVPATEPPATTATLTLLGDTAAREGTWVPIDVGSRIVDVGSKVAVDDDDGIKGVQKSTL